MDSNSSGSSGSRRAHSADSPKLVQENDSSGRTERSSSVPRTDQNINESRDFHKPMALNPTQTSSFVDASAGNQTNNPPKHDEPGKDKSAVSASESNNKTQPSSPGPVQETVVQIQPTPPSPELEIVSSRKVERPDRGQRMSQHVLDSAHIVPNGVSPTQMTYGKHGPMNNAHVLPMDGSIDPNLSPQKRKHVPTDLPVTPQKQQKVDAASTPSRLRKNKPSLWTVPAYNGGTSLSSSSTPACLPDVNQSANRPESSNTSTLPANKPLSYRNWLAKDYYGLVQMANENLPFERFCREYNKSPQEAKEAWQAMTMMPLLGQSLRELNQPRGGLGEEMVKMRRQMERLTLEYQKKVKELEAKESAMRAEVEKEVWEKAEKHVRMKVAEEVRTRIAGSPGDLQKVVGAGTAPPTPTPNPTPSARGRKPNRVKTVDEAMDDLVDAGEQLKKARKAEERKAKKGSK